MNKNLLLLAAMIVTDTITFDQAKQWVEFCDEAEVQHAAPVSLETAVDLALSYFRLDPDTEAANEAAKIAAAHDAPHGTCCECGEQLDPDEMITELDVDMAVDAWVYLRGMVRMRDALEQEEC